MTRSTEFTRLLAGMLLALSVLLPGCGGGDSATFAAQSSPVVDKPVSGPTPFIASVRIASVDASRVAVVSFEVAPKAGATARPVRASFTIDYLRRKGYAASGDGLTLPLFGLYAGRTNSVSIEILFSDGSRTVLPLSVVSAAYVDPFKVYDRPQIIKVRAPSASLGFDYFFMKSGLGPPVIVDTDAEIRWAGVGVQASATSILLDNGFVMIDGNLNLQRLELDGSAVNTLGKIQSSAYVSVLHNIDPGKVGILVEPDAVINGQPAIESILAEVDLQGNVLSEWNFADILSKYMTQAGDDPSLLVRPGIDWFHMNSAL